MSNNEKIRGYVENNLVIFNEEIKFSDSDNIFQLGFVNSLFAMKLIGFIEQEYDIKIESEDLNIENFSSINKILEFINKKGE